MGRWVDLSPTRLVAPEGPADDGKRFHFSEMLGVLR